MVKTRSIFLYPAALLYGAITGIKNFLFNADVLKANEFSIPVICIGNLTVGGTGKTPHTEYIADLLRKNFKVSVLSRGYKRSSSGFRVADRNSRVEDIGDEPLQMAGKLTDVVVAVDRNRVNGVREILKAFPETSVVILDDAYQHRRITPGLSILLSDFNRLMIHDHMLPYGDLRESSRNMDRADIILITKSPENISPIQRRIVVKDINKAPYQNLYFTTVTYKDPLPVFKETEPEQQWFESGDDKGAVLVTGIANPKPLEDYLQKTFKEIIHLSYGDHHSFTQKDIDKITKAWNNLKSTRRYILTTEKDSVRLREFSNIAEPFRSSFYYIPVGIAFLNNDKKEFDNLILDYVRKNKRNNRIS